MRVPFSQGVNWSPRRISSEIVVVDARLVKGRHVVDDSARSVEHLKGERTAAPLAQSHAEVKQRAQVHRLHREAVADLKRGVARHQVAAHIRAQPDGAQRRRGGNEAVDDRWPTCRRRAQKRAAHRREVKAADLGKDADNVVPVRPIYLNGGADDRFLFAKLSSVIPPPRPVTGLDVRSQQHGQHRRRGRRVADAHFADTDHVRVDCPRDLCAGQDGL